MSGEYQNIAGEIPDDPISAARAKGLAHAAELARTAADNRPMLHPEYGCPIDDNRMRDPDIWYLQVEDAFHRFNGLKPLEARQATYEVDAEAAATSGAGEMNLSTPAGIVEAIVKITTRPHTTGPVRRIQLGFEGTWRENFWAVAFQDPSHQEGLSKLRAAESPEAHTAARARLTVTTLRMLAEMAGGVYQLPADGNEENIAPPAQDSPTEPAATEAIAPPLPERSLRRRAGSFVAGVVAIAGNFI